MIDFLKEVGISKRTIKEIESNNTNSSLFDLSCNNINCLKIVLYLKEIGILNIDNLLINKIDLFKMDYQELVKKFSKFNIPVFISLVNDDIEVIENIYLV